MNWQKLTKTNLPPMGVPIDIITVSRGRPKRLCSCRFMRSLETFRTEVALRDIPFKDVTHWMVVTLPGDESEVATIENALDNIAEAGQLVAPLLQLGFLSSKAKTEASFQLRGILTHLQKTADIIVSDLIPEKPTKRFDI